ncbi:MAG TPA: dihydroorotase [Candidatus Dormibacteraeota bacterium]|nr:dihydroorotase [Candidatus Dormibacteraeota bacterium]
MSQILLQAVRLIDPVNGVDLEGCDLLIEDGVLQQVGAEMSPPKGATVLRRRGSVVAPSFVDLHCHLREPGQPWKERIARATAAASAGGFGAICAMANLNPPVDSLESLRRSQRDNKAWARVPILQFAACTKDLAGLELTNLEALARAGAAGFSDDGRHGLSQELLAEALRRAGALGLIVAIHPEDEALLVLANRGNRDPGQWRIRPPGAELSAIEHALSALRQAPGARLHLQHVSTAASVELVRRAKAEGLPVTAEVTPHHLMLTGASGDAGPADPGRCNPPLRTEADRMALWEALLEGTIDAIASDHAPHEAAPPSERLPGFSGIQLVLSAVLGQGGALSHLGRVVETLTAGPRRVLGDPGSAVPGDGIRSGESASLTWFDPNQSWTPSPQSWLSLGTNTPFWGEPLKGTVLATFARGRMVHLNRELVPELGDV